MLILIWVARPKRVCRSHAGSALLADEKKVARILEAVVNAVHAPVTLKMRTGIDPQNKNAISIAKIAEDLQEYNRLPYMDAHVNACIKEMLNTKQ